MVKSFFGSYIFTHIWHKLYADNKATTEAEQTPFKNYAGLMIRKDAKEIVQLRLKCSDL